MTDSGVSRLVEAVTQAPADYGRLAELYEDDMRRVVRSMLGPGAQQADVAETLQYVYSKILPGGNRSGIGVIEQYDPSVRSRFTGNPIPFRSFLLNKVSLYCRGRRESLSTHYGRERLTADAPVSGGASWIELFGPSRWDSYEAMDEDEFAARMRECAETWEDGASPPLRPLFDLMASEAEAGHFPTPAQVGRKLGMSAQEAGDYIGRLQGALSSLPAAVRYEAGGLQLTAAEMRAAAEALRAIPGHHVMPAFQLIEHRLAKCGKTWYVKVARKEMKLYPAARIPAGTPKNRTTPVKFALQHWFDRLCPPLADAERSAEPVPALEPDNEDDTARDLLEAMLWRLPGATAEKVDAILARTAGAVAEAVRDAFGET